MYSISSTFTLVINFIFGKGKGWHMGERNSDKKKITAKEFKNMISNGEKIEDSIVLEDIDLKNQIFCNLEIVDVEFQKSVDFSNSVFTGNTFLQELLLDFTLIFRMQFFRWFVLKEHRSHLDLNLKMLCSQVLINIIFLTSHQPRVLKIRS